MPPFRKHIFICTNDRPNDPNSSCAPKGGKALQIAFKERLKQLGLNTEIRANQSGCLDACQHGVAVVIYPAQVWYGGVTLDDVNEIIDKSIIHDDVVERLLVTRSK